MSIPEVEEFSLRTNTRDKYGKVTTTADVVYSGMVERQTQFRGGSSPTVIGEGVVFCSSIQSLAVVGQEIIIGTDVYTIVQVLDLKDGEGTYHHTELVYG